MSSISDFFAGKTLFVTGGTGTVGKVIIEKLLRSCNKVDKIFILLRPKFRAGAVSKDRLNDFINEPVFENLRMNNVSVFGKLVAVAGDLEEQRLGISDSQRALLLSEVQIVIHVGANVTFDLPILEAMKVNVGGTRGLLELFTESSKLLAFLHVSTLFLRRDDLLEERVYDSQIYEQVQTMLGGKSEEEVKRLESQLLQGKCNSYIFSKTSAEYAVQGFQSKFPIVIVRLPIVGPCLKEPIPGFMESRLTVSAFFLAAANGVLPYAFVKRECVADIVPADVCANVILASSWYRANHRDKSIIVINLTPQHSFTWENFKDALNISIKKYHAKTILWFPHIQITSSLVWFKLVTLLFMYLPAMFLDLIATLNNQQPKNLYILFKIQHSIAGFREFSNRNWKVSKENIRFLRKIMSDKDKAEFPTGEEKIDCETYMDDYGKVVRKHVFKMADTDDAACAKALRRSKLLEMFRYSFVFILVGLFVIYGIVIHYVF